MEISDDVLCFFSAQVEEQNDSYIVTIPEREVTTGNIKREAVYRVAIFSNDATQTTPVAERSQNPEHDGPHPPVEVGDWQTVDIEDIGGQGDGIARVERGYVIVVAETDMNERVTIEITSVKENFAFGDVVEREAYYQ
jgi:predicted RNA-binding protein with TRAM domain